MRDSGSAESARAVETARASVGVGPDAEAAARLVMRLEPGREPYFLVGLSLGDRGWVVAVSSDGTAVRQVAEDPAGARSWWVDVPEELVWAPGTWSRSPLYPLRRGTDGGRAVLLDHLGRRLPPGPVGPG
ncbi:hypothetical protein GA707_08625 [Nostocoides sp. F2B08]|uniref:hypothetical protein n=1 Tax=Nostocoides sp. F2B08 TaxID=2653936 RepID=UPI0012637015|nr:hypothetical protein [Tetrasphaera sp. F2B08]KAB7744650.1 hypothetical protein GA707_08625 [Tetrasphaera sp. F2B08]